jgi:hypothetical protein
MIKAIETRYKGYRFRSRLEARWAVFFDACCYQWEYEPEGFALPCGTYYLPDFKIFGEDQNGDYNVFYIEVKPSHEGIFDPKVKAFQDAVFEDEQREDWENKILKGYGDFIILDGPPDKKLYHGTLPYSGDGGRQWIMEPFYRDRPSFWSAKDYNDALYWCGADPFEWNPFCPIEKALSARFEHGETPL